AAEHAAIPPQDLNALDPAIWPRSARRADGALTIAGTDVRDLAGQYGTPAFVLDEEDFRGRCRDFIQAFGERAAVFYAVKAFCCRGVLRWAAEEGLGVDVCTGGEPEVGRAAGVDPAMIPMHGNNKLLSDLERAVATGVGHVVVDSFEEIARLAFVTEERDGVAGGVRPADDRIAPKKDEPPPPRPLGPGAPRPQAPTPHLVPPAPDD